MEFGYPFLTILVFALFKAGAVSGSIGGVIETLLGEVAGAASSESARQLWDRLRNHAPGEGTDELQRAVSRSFLSALLQTIRAYAEQHNISVQAPHAREHLPTWGPIDNDQIRREGWVQQSAAKLARMIDAPLPESADLSLPEPDMLFRNGRVTPELTDRVWEWMTRQVPNPPDDFREVFEQRWFAALQEAFRKEIQDGKPALVFIATEVSENKEISREILREVRDLNPKNSPKKPPDLNRYWEWLRGVTEHIEFKGLQLAGGKLPHFEIHRLYMPLRTKPPESRGEANSVRIEEALVHRSIVILGGAGSGKTTLLRHIAWQLCEGVAPTLTLPFQGHFPILIRVSDLDEHYRNCCEWKDVSAPRTEADHGWISHYLGAGTLGLDRDFFEDRLLRKDTVVLVDGLDEGANQSRRVATKRMLESARAFYPCRFIASTRPHTHQADAELSGAFTKLWIEDLDEPTMKGFLRQWSECLYGDNGVAVDSHHKALTAALAASEIRKMAANPLMLTAVALIYQHQRRLPDHRSELYEAVLVWLAQQRGKREGRPDWQTCLRLLGSLALRMQEAPAGGQAMQLAVRTAAECIAADVWFRRRAVEAEERLAAAEEFLHLEEGDSGILASGRGANLRFWHRSFQEYLAARYLVRQCPDLVTRLTGTVESTGLLYTPHWREIMILLLGHAVNHTGTGHVDLWFNEILVHAEQLPFAQQAYAVGMLGAMLSDLPRGLYAMDPDVEVRYARFAKSVMAIFDTGAHRTIGIQDRIAAADALALAGDPRLCTPDKPDYWVEIPEGRGWVGSTKKDMRSPVYDPDHASWEMEPEQVHVERPFQIGRYPVTVYEYQHYLELPGVKRKPPEEWGEQIKHPSRPVVYISREDAQAYCDHYHCKLPTEQQWEYAARGGGEKPRRYPWGDQPPDETLLNFNSNIGHPTPVGLFPEGNTPQGVSDMAGNVWERTTNNPWKGASYFSEPQRVRSAYRGVSYGVTSVDFGFRCLRE